MVLQAIVDGLRESVLAFSHNVEGTSPKDVLDMVLVTQYFDTMKVRNGECIHAQRGRERFVCVPKERRKICVACKSIKQLEF